MWYAGLDGTTLSVPEHHFTDLQWSEGTSTSSFNLDTRLKLEISFTRWLFLSRCDLQYLQPKLTIYRIDAAFNIIRRFRRILLTVNRIEELHIQTSQMPRYVRYIFLCKSFIHDEKTKSDLSIK